MVMRDIGSFHCPEPRFISRGEAEGNKLGRGEMNSAIQYIYARLFTLVYFFYDHVNRKSDHTMSRLCHGTSHIYEEFLS